MNTFFIFWHYKILQLHPTCFFPESWNQSILLRSIGSLLWRVILQTKIWGLDVLFAVRISLFLGLSSDIEGINTTISNSSKLDPKSHCEKKFLSIILFLVKYLPILTKYCVGKKFHLGFHTILQEKLKVLTSLTTSFAILFEHKVSIDYSRDFFSTFIFTFMKNKVWCALVTFCVWNYMVWRTRLITMSL